MPCTEIACYAAPYIASLCRLVDAEVADVVTEKT